MHLLPILAKCEIFLFLIFPLKYFHIGLVGSILDENLNELEDFRESDPSLKDDGPNNAAHACDVFFYKFSKRVSISSNHSIESVFCEVWFKSSS